MGIIYSNSIEDHMLPIALAGATLGGIYYLFGVPKVNDKLNLIYNPDSALLNQVITHTDLGNLTFKTCLAGTINTV